MSTFGSEFKVTKRAVEYVHGLRYNLRMMGILCEDPTFVYSDNNSVLASAIVPGYTLKKRMNSSSITLLERYLHGINGVQHMLIRILIWIIYLQNN